MNEFDNVTWVLEASVFPASHSRMLGAVRGVSAEAVLWRDEWLEDESWPRLSGRVVIFHGSLNNAAVTAERLPWKPGSFCDAEGFCCSRWYPRAERWLLHRTWALSSVEELATSAG